MNNVDQISLTERLFSHPAVLQRMLLRLSLQAADPQTPDERPLANLTTRDTDDPTIALLDACAITLDVLDFYQQTINREAYLSTANELFSIRALARSIGYELSPGVAASTFLVFTIDDNVSSTTIAQGTQVQNIPQQDASPQTFETSSELVAKAEWNKLGVHQPLTEIVQTVSNANRELRLQGTQTGLQIGDVILLTSDNHEPLLLTLNSIESQYDDGYTLIRWEQDKPDQQAGMLVNVKVFAFRQHIGCFGHNAASYISLNNTTLPDWDTNNPSIWQDASASYYNDADLYLSQYLPKILPGSWVALTNPDNNMALYQIDSINSNTLADFSLSSRVTGLSLKHYSSRNFLTNDVIDKPNIFQFRNTTIYVQSEPLLLFKEKQPQANFVIAKETVEGKPSEIALNKVVSGLQSGHKLILTGVPVGAMQVVSEVVTVASSRIISTTKEGEEDRILILLRDKLTQDYKPGTVYFYGNVVASTQGESITEVLGNGNSIVANQEFLLQKSPLTYVPAATTNGVESTLKIRVNDVLWHEVANLQDADTNDKVYMVRLNESNQTRVIFGDGEKGARLPTGQENIVASYRIGMGLVGQVAAGSLTLLQDRPLGVKEVTNPLPATGGVDLESVTSARQNAPLTVLTMDRVVSLRDFEHFTQAFTGIGKAQARLIKRGQTPLLHITIASQMGEPIDENSALYKNLVQAIEVFRTPGQVLHLNSLVAQLFNIAARLKIDADHLADKVFTNVISHLHNIFSFEQRQFSQSVTATEIISAIQQVEGVVAVDLDTLHYQANEVALNAILVAQSARVISNETMGAELLTINQSVDGILLEEMSS